MVMTRETFQTFKAWLKEDAWKNVDYNAAVFHIKPWQMTCFQTVSEFALIPWYLYAGIVLHVCVKKCVCVSYFIHFRKKLETHVHAGYTRIHNKYIYYNTIQTYIYIYIYIYTFHAKNHNIYPSYSPTCPWRVKRPSDLGLG